MINDIISFFSTAINSCFNWFNSLLVATNTFDLVFSVVLICMICRFLLFPFFKGSINAGISDRVKQNRNKQNNSNNQRKG